MAIKYKKSDYRLKRLLKQKTNRPYKFYPFDYLNNFTLFWILPSIRIADCFYVRTVDGDFDRKAVFSDNTMVGHIKILLNAGRLFYPRTDKQPFT